MNTPRKTPRQSHSPASARQRKPLATSARKPRAPEPRGLSKFEIGGIAIGSLVAIVIVGAFIGKLVSKSPEAKPDADANTVAKVDPQAPISAPSTDESAAPLTPKSVPPPSEQNDEPAGETYVPTTENPTTPQPETPSQPQPTPLPDPPPIRPTQPENRYRPLSSFTVVSLSEWKAIVTREKAAIQQANGTSLDFSDMWKRLSETYAVQFVEEVSNVTQAFNARSFDDENICVSFSMKSSRAMDFLGWGGVFSVRVPKGMRDEFKKGSRWTITTRVNGSDPLREGNGLAAHPVLNTTVWIEAK